MPYLPVQLPTVAQAFASLAVTSPSRVFLGVRTGERLNEQAATRQFDPYQDRHDRLSKQSSSSSVNVTADAVDVNALRAEVQAVLQAWNAEPRPVASLLSHI
jgi:hypothetical protein